MCLSFFIVSVFSIPCFPEICGLNRHRITFNLNVIKNWMRNVLRYYAVVKDKW